MFRKFADRISAAATNAFGDSTSHGVDRLVAMGFDRGTATQALQATNGNVEEAAELLLAQQQAQQPPPPQRRPANKTPPPRRQQQQQQQDEEEDLRRAMEASLQTATHQPQQPQQRTAAMQKAAQAAEARQKEHDNWGKKKKKMPTTTTTTATQKHHAPSGYNNNANKLSLASGALAANHPGVKVIPKLQDKSVEEQILRCADRVKASPAAVDTLHKACVTIQQHPHEAKYRTIDTTTAGFQRSLAPAPGALDFLRAMNFQTLHNKLYLSQVDPARLYLGISALEQTKLSPEYVEAKSRLQLTAELRQIHDNQKSNEDDEILKCPSEPPEGRGAWMQVALADYETVRRRFDADDTLQDVLHWLAVASRAGPLLLERLQVSRGWMLCDVNRYPVQPLDCAKHSQSTLQYLGLWPSGRLELKQGTDEWKQATDGAADADPLVRGSARGLGAAPKEAL